MEPPFSATATSNYIYLVPLVTMISSALLLHERITPVALTGAMMILGGVYVVPRCLTAAFHTAKQNSDAIRPRKSKLLNTIGRSSIAVSVVSGRIRKTGSRVSTP